TQRRELFLHAVRDLVYAMLFAVLGWSAPHGGIAIALVAVMLGEIGITLWDFVEEDRTRKLPSSERVTHAVLTLNCGVVLTSLAPLFRHWMSLPTAIGPAYYGIWSWLCALASIGVAISGLRDLLAAFRAPRIGQSEAAPLAAALKGRRTILITGGTGF